MDHLEEKREGVSAEALHPEQGRSPSYRAGVAARLIGLSPETLRVWERRYKVSGADRTEKGHRLYSAEQVRRLGVVKQLVDQGHAIGSIAHLSLEALQNLLQGAVVTVAYEGPIHVAVVGAALGRRIAACGIGQSVLRVVASCGRLGDAIPVPVNTHVEVLIVESSELHANDIPAVLAARDACKAAAVVVLYRFCASATIRLLRGQGCTAARVPGDLAELQALCRVALSRERAPEAPVMSPSEVPPLRFDEALLSSIEPRAEGVACECPRHLADLLMMVGSFERYSAQCASRNEDDARLHRELGLAAGRARAILETAMETLMRAEGLWK